MQRVRRRLVCSRRGFRIHASIGGVILVLFQELTHGLSGPGLVFRVAFTLDPFRSAAPQLCIRVNHDDVGSVFSRDIPKVVPALVAVSEPRLVVRRVCHRQCH